MLASEVKLAQNNLDVILRVLDALRYIRQATGYGSIKMDVKNGMVLNCVTSIRDNIASDT